MGARDGFAGGDEKVLEFRGHEGVGSTDIDAASGVGEDEDGFKEAIVVVIVVVFGSVVVVSSVLMRNHFFGFLQFSVRSTILIIEKHC